MLRDTTLPTERAWNTWSDRPAEMVFLPLGVRVTPVAYSSHLQRASLFAPGPDLRLGEHAIDGSRVDVQLRLGGTHLDWAWRKHGPYALSAAWRIRARGEWGLRFWLNVCLWAEGGESVAWTDDAAVVRVGTRYVALCAGAAPVQVTGHATVADLARDYEENGYFDLRSRATAAPVLALRFNLEMMPQARLGVAVADDPQRAIAAARALTRAAVPAAEHAAGTAADDAAGAAGGDAAAALAAIEDVMGWNGVYDPINRRPYTCISRNWNQRKFGGFGVWLDDQFYHALATGLLDPAVARENLLVALGNATPQGNLACLVTAADAWIDRTQIPVGAFVVRLLAERLADRSIVALAYDTLARNHAWWWEQRDPTGSGLVSYGSSAIGTALYAGTAFGARNESSMDNSPTHDEAIFDPQTRTLTTIDVGLNSLLALDAQCLAALARELGRRDEAAALDERAAALCARIGSTLWDPARGIFANRLRGGGFVRSLGPTSFFPLLCGAAAPGQVTRLLQHLDDPATFAGAYPLPSVTRDDPAFADNSYWRGRIWPPLNYLVWQGLRRNGLHERASRLAADSYQLFRQSWEGARLCPENYNADTGAALDQPDTEGFYGWGVLMPLMAVGELTDVSAWDGWEISNRGSDARVGPIQTPAGRVTVERRGGRVQVTQDGRVLLACDVPGRITQLRLQAGYAALTLPARIPPGCSVTVGDLAGRTIVLARLDDGDLGVAADGSMRLPPRDGSAGARLVLVYR